MVTMCERDRAIPPEAGAALEAGERLVVQRFKMRYAVESIYELQRDEAERWMFAAYLRRTGRFEQ